MNIQNRLRIKIIEFSLKIKLILVFFSQQEFSCYFKILSSLNE